MSDAVTTIQAAANTLSATSSLLDALVDLLPKIGWTTALAMAFIPQPSPDSPAPLRYLFKVATWIAGNFGHAKNNTAVAAEKAEARSDAVAVVVADAVASQEKAS
jgi:hypothetical protein